MGQQRSVNDDLARRGEGLGGGGELEHPAGNDRLEASCGAAYHGAEDRAGGQPHAHAEGKDPGGRLQIDVAAHVGLESEGAGDRAAHHRRPVIALSGEEGRQRVAAELGDNAAIRLDEGNDRREVGIDERRQLLGAGRAPGHSGAQGAKAADIGEEDNGRDAPLVAEQLHRGIGCKLTRQVIGKKGAPRH